jgi:hypothetical protein
MSLKHECLCIRMPIIYQGIQQPGLCPHERTLEEFQKTTLSQCDSSIRVLSDQKINFLMLPLSPVNIHPAIDKFMGD